MNTTIDTIARECIAVRVRMLNRIITGIYDDALRPLGLRLAHPEPQRRRGQIQLARDGAHRLAFVEDQPYGPVLELVRELPPDSPATPA